MVWPFHRWLRYVSTSLLWAYCLLLFPNGHFPPEAFIKDWHGRNWLSGTGSLKPFRSMGVLWAFFHFVQQRDQRRRRKQITIALIKQTVIWNKGKNKRLHSCFPPGRVCAHSHCVSQTHKHTHEHTHASMLVMALFLRKVNSSQFSMLWCREGESKVKEKWGKTKRRQNCQEMPEEQGCTAIHKLGSRYINCMKARGNIFVNQGCERNNILLLSRLRISNFSNYSEETRCHVLRLYGTCLKRPLQDILSVWPTIVASCVTSVEGINFSKSRVLCASKQIQQQHKEHRVHMAFDFWHFHSWCTQYLQCRWAG